MHVKRAPEVNPPTTCVDFTYAEREPFEISEEKNRVLGIQH